MNAFVVAICVNLVVFVDAEKEEINFDTILQLIKARRSNAISEADSINDPIETIPVIPGFYWQKPNELSTALFKNPAPWPDFRYKNATTEDIKSYQTKIEDKSRSLKDDHLTEKIVRAVKNLNRYRESQKSLNTEINKPGGSLEISERPPVAKLMSQILKEIKASNRDRNENYIYKLKQSIGSDRSKNLEKLLNKYLNTNGNRNYYQGSQNSYRYDETEERTTYNDAYKDVLGNILKAIDNNNQNRENNMRNQPSVILIETLPHTRGDTQRYLRSRLLARNVADFLYGRPHSSSFHNNAIDRNEAREVGNNDYESNDPDYKYSGRRKDDSSSSTDESDDTSVEKNPGNPFTIHKNKYKQNWPYDHFMDGDHMNINPFGPQFQSLGPSGPELFFGRKWWYFNQDDYKPMG